MTDDELLTIDVPAALAAGRAGGEVTVAAALQAERLGVLPRSLTFLAEVVRRGGLAYAIALPEPLPTPEQSALAAGWMARLAEDDAARWLDAVAAVLAIRR
jgi:hypothetical protein